MSLSYLLDREVATLLAALRLFQERRAEGESMPHFFGTSPDEPGVEVLNDEEIDNLCEEINNGDDNRVDDDACSHAPNPLSIYLVTGQGGMRPLIGNDGRLKFMMAVACDRCLRSGSFEVSVEPDDIDWS